MKVPFVIHLVDVRVMHLYVIAATGEAGSVGKVEFGIPAVCRPMSIRCPRQDPCGHGHCQGAG